MAYKFEWENKAVGTAPGQHQTLEITLKYRNRDEIKIAFKFSATSNGHDDFGPNNRNNYGYIWIGGHLVKPDSNNKYTFKYNSYFGSLDKGTPKTHTRSGEVTFTGVAPGITSLDIYYQNDRINESGTYPNNPCTTGVFKKAKIGTLSIPDWRKHTITFNSGYKNGDIANLPNTFTIYDGLTYSIPNINLVDLRNHFVFQNGYSLETNSNINTSDPTIPIGANITALKSITYYACWKPQSYKYRFFSSSNLNEEFSTLTTGYTFGNSPTILPNLNDKNRFNNLTSKEQTWAYKTGYEFTGWDSLKGKISVPNLSCSYDSDTNFYISWGTVKYNVKFDYGFDNYTYEAKNLTYNTKFNFSTLLKTKEGKKVNNTLVRPGYKLVGWSYTKPTKIYDYGETIFLNFNYGVNSESIIKLPPSTTSNEALKNGITLYAVWEYFALSYISDEELNKWKLALSYVYDNNRWKLVVPYIYDNTTKTWKV